MSKTLQVNDCDPGKVEETHYKFIKSNKNLFGIWQIKVKLCLFRMVSCLEWKERAEDELKALARWWRHHYDGCLYLCFLFFNYQTSFPLLFLSKIKPNMDMSKFS